MKKNYLKKFIPTFLTTVILFLFGIYLYKNPQILDALKSIFPIYVFIVMVIFLLVFLLEGLFIKVTLNVFDKDISLKESYYLSTISRIGNYLLPLRAGAVFRATYLKNKYSFDYTKFLSTLYAYYILLFLINSLIALIILTIKYLSIGDIYPLITLFFITLFIGTLLVILLRKPIIISTLESTNILAKVLLLLGKFVESWDIIVTKRTLFKSLLLITTGNIFLNAVINYIEFLSLGLKLNILDIILYTCISGVSLLISITPGSLGLREAVFLLTSESIGLSSEQIMQLAFLDRGIMFLLLVILLLLITIFVKQFKLKDIFIVKK